MLAAVAVLYPPYGSGICGREKNLRPSEGQWIGNGGEQRGAQTDASAGSTH